MKTSISRHFILPRLCLLWKHRFFFQFSFIVFPYKFGAFLQSPSFCASAQNTSLFLYISNNPSSLPLLFLFYGLTAFLSKKKELQKIKIIKDFRQYRSEYGVV